MKFVYFVFKVTGALTKVPQDTLGSTAPMPVAQQLKSDHKCKQYCASLPSVRVLLQFDIYSPV